MYTNKCLRARNPTGSIITIFVTRRRLQTIKHGDDKVGLWWAYGRMFCFSQIEMNLFTYQPASTITPKQVVVHLEMLLVFDYYETEIVAF